MPNKFQKAAGGASTGAAIGSVIPGVGTAVGAGIGGLLGFFMGSDKEPEYISPSFADINLKNENPELYAELMRLQAMSDQAEAMYNQRRAGMTYSERQGLEEAMGNQAQQQANQGLLGSSAGAAMQADAEARLRDQIQQRAFQEQQALFGNMAQQRAAKANALMAAQNQIMGLKTHGADINYNQAMAEEQAANQFYSGLFNGGLGMLGQYQNMQGMKDIANMQYGQLGPNELPTNIPAGLMSEGPSAPQYYGGVPSYNSPGGMPSYNPSVPFWMRG